MRNIFTEIQDKAVALITGKIRPEGHAFNKGRSRKYSRGGYFLFGGLPGYITHITVDMGQFIGGYLGNPFYAISSHFTPLTNDG